MGSGEKSGRVIGKTENDPNRRAPGGQTFTKLSRHPSSLGAVEGLVTVTIGGGFGLDRWLQVLELCTRVFGGITLISAGHGALLVFLGE